MSFTNGVASRVYSFQTLQAQSIQPQALFFDEEYDNAIACLNEVIDLLAANSVADRAYTDTVGTAAQTYALGLMTDATLDNVASSYTARDYIVSAEFPTVIFLKTNGAFNEKQYRVSVASDGELRFSTLDDTGALIEDVIQIARDGTVRFNGPVDIRAGLRTGSDVSLAPNGAPVFPQYTTAELTNAAHPVNASGDKRRGLVVYEIENRRLLVTNDNGTTSPWRNVATGDVVYTPS